MDCERLEDAVLRCPLAELEFHHASGAYTLGNSVTKPAWWSVRYEPSSGASPTSFGVRGLHTALTLIERMYPQWYAWLLATFPAEGETGSRC